MSKDVILLLIGAIISATITFLFWLIKRFIDRRDKNSINSQYLEKFYAPIYNQMESNKFFTYKNAFDTIDEVSKTSPQAVPEYFLEWKSRYIYRIDSKDLETMVDKDFITHIKVNYTWLRKKLHFDNKKVDKNDLHHLDCYNKKREAAETINYMLMVFLAIIFSEGLLMLYYNHKDLAYTLLSGSFFGLIVYLLKNYISKWNG